MRSFLLLLVLWALSVFAQPTITRGGGLKKRAYQTYGAMTLYVDPSGSDSNAYTSSGTDACATLHGAMGKVPRFVRHRDSRPLGSDAHLHWRHQRAAG